ncbi:hypothetical protein AB0J52_18895 [Spirillospora sp. NPDC049652]
MSAPFVIRPEHDPDRADDIVSHFADRVRQCAHADGTPWAVYSDSARDQQVARAHFAELSWRAATLPPRSAGQYVAPMYVEFHDLIPWARLSRNIKGEEVLPIAQVGVSVSLPPEVAGLAGWQDVPFLRRGDHYVQSLPEDQLTAVRQGGYAFTTAALYFPLHVDLPDVPASADSEELAAVAAAYIKILVSALNDAVGPVIEALKRR